MRNLRRVGGIVLFTLMMIACGNDSSYIEGETADGNFILVDEVSQRVSDDMIVKVVGITDTRCPIGDVCSTAGSVKVDMQIYADKEFTDFCINYSKLHEDNCDTIKGYTISILNVTPHQYSGAPKIDSLDYRITISVEKN